MSEEGEMNKRRTTFRIARSPFRHGGAGMKKKKRTSLCKKRKLNVYGVSLRDCPSFRGSTFKLFLCPASIGQCAVTSCPNSSRNQCPVGKAVTMSRVCMYVRACTSSLYSTFSYRRRRTTTCVVIAIEIRCPLFSRYEKDGNLSRLSLETVLVICNILTQCVCSIGFFWSDFGILQNI